MDGDTGGTVPLWLHQLQVQLSGTLGRLEEGQKGIHTRLDKLNGSVADHTKRLGEIDSRNAARTYGCPLLNDIRKLTNGLSEQIEILQEGATADREADALVKAEVDKDRAIASAIKAQAERWYKRLSPYIQWVIVAIIVLLVSHYNEIMKMIRGG